MTDTQDSTAMPAELLRRLQAAGLRRTLATRAVVGVFLARADQGLTHAQVFAALQARGHDTNRVTVYRLLERLVAAGVLSRRTDDERTWRFALVAPATPARASRTGASAPRFACRECQREFVLDLGGAAHSASRELLRAVSQLGHRGDAVALTVHGRCASCRAQGEAA